METLQEVHRELAKANATKVNDPGRCWQWVKKLTGSSTVRVQVLKQPKGLIQGPRKSASVELSKK